MTQDDVTRLERALAQGATKVTFADGRSVEYHSFAELTKRLEYVRRQLGQDEASAIIKTTFSKGVQC